ncbi:MAG: hypothetical protein WBG92_01135 [Thiohalocapsa sp.]
MEIVLVLLLVIGAVSLGSDQPPAAERATKTAEVVTVDQMTQTTEQQPCRYGEGLLPQRNLSRPWTGEAPR